MLCRAVLGSSDQFGWSDAERDRESGDGCDGRPALGALDPAEIVAVDAALEPEALLGEAELVAAAADRLAEADEQWVGCGHGTAPCSPSVSVSTLQPCCSYDRCRRLDRTDMVLSDGMRGKQWRWIGALVLLILLMPVAFSGCGSGASFSKRSVEEEERRPPAPAVQQAVVEVLTN
jgi:hypothetical protein